MKDGGQLVHVCICSVVQKMSHRRFPWESARTGVDVTPDCCPEVRLYQMHITGDIAFAARQYIAATGNENWLLNELGGDLIYETARFWGTRAIYNNEKRQYEILSKYRHPFLLVCQGVFYTTAVLPPDEDAQPFKNNSVYTNAVAALSIELADRVSCVTRKRVPRDWLNIASNLHFPFDNATQTHLEYEDFNLSESMDRATPFDRLFHVFLLRKHYHQAG
jgi:protein-glucosylgalactosylhydroxylysine glucosidase